MFKSLRQGLVKTVSLPSYGKQDVGITPGGAMDCFSYKTGNILLGNPDDAQAMEILYPPVLEFQEDGWFVLTGAAYTGVRLKMDGQILNILHGKVYRASRCSVLSFGERSYGFRSYLCFRIAEHNGSRDPEGRERGSYYDIARWPDSTGYIRVVEGPEYKYMDNAEQFLEHPWTISRDSSDMGMRIDNPAVKLSVSIKNMVSEAVATGTVQLTAGGPIILLKQRQTVGGYPRIYNVISADTDLLAQYLPDQKINFRKISLEEAGNVLRMQADDINRLKRRIKLENL